MPRPTLRTSDGLDLAGRRRLTDNVPRAAVVVVHGFNASASCPNVEALADALHDDGYDVITYVHGTEDRFIPARDAALLCEATPHPRRLVVVPDMGHAFAPAAIEPVRAAVAWSLAPELSATS
jgi:pimeloyl-ACP methyl ester carboxylesterase